MMALLAKFCMISMKVGMLPVVMPAQKHTHTHTHTCTWTRTRRTLSDFVDDGIPAA